MCDKQDKTSPTWRMVTLTNGEVELINAGLDLLYDKGVHNKPHSMSFETWNDLKCHIKRGDDWSCPRCGHTGRQKVDDKFKCYHPTCPVSYYDPRHRADYLTITKDDVRRSPMSYGHKDIGSMPD